MRAFGGSWSESKLDCVESYVASYLNVMQKQSWCTLEYIDAFAGSGEQKLRVAANADPGTMEMVSFFGDASEKAEAKEFLVGSALRALAASEKSARPFDRFLFVDSDDTSCADLALRISTDHPALRPKVEILCEDANSALIRHVGTINWTNVRAVVFLDPYGMEVEWSTVEALAHTAACDVWYLFPLGGVIRMMTNSGVVPDSWRTWLERVFGTPDWYSEFYSASEQRSLFDDADGFQVKKASTDHVIDYMRRRLKMVFPAVSNAGILRNSKGAPLFALVLGVSSQSPAAQRAALGIANHLVKDLEK